MTSLDTAARNTWCPGCGNFGILNAVKPVIQELEQDGLSREDFVLVADIGCHGKIMDYVGVNSFNALHGRSVAAAAGIKLADPRLKVVVHVGDGSGFAEGLEHILFAAKRNMDITVILHDNGVYGLTIGQAGPETPRGYRGRSTPYGSVEDPFNPLDLLATAGATYLARGYSRGRDLLKRLCREAILHPGFAVVDTLQVCATFRNLYDFYNERVYELESHDPRDEARGLAAIREWDYRSDGPIALGTMLVRDRPVFATDAPGPPPEDLDAAVGEVLANLV